MVCSPKCAYTYAKSTTKKNKESIKKAKDEDDAKKRKEDLQKEINKLSRMIDESFGYRCIDCDEPYSGQVDAAHYISRGSNSTLRYNLHNIHSSRAHCNQYSDTHKVGYYKGLIKRYSPEYANYVDSELANLYPKLKLMDHEVAEKLKITRKLIRTFPTLQFKDGREARESLNKIIGIY
jgi:hypothetical protein